METPFGRKVQPHRGGACRWVQGPANPAASLLQSLNSSNIWWRIDIKGYKVFFLFIFLIPSWSQ